MDEKLLEDLLKVREAETLFARAGTPSELWERFCVRRGAPAPFEAALARLRGGAADVDRAVLDPLLGVRRRFGPLVQDLRSFCALLADAPAGERLEMLLGFMMISPKALELLGRWLFDPQGCLAEGGEKLRAMMSVVDDYRAALPPPELDAPPPPRPAPAPAVKAEPPKPPQATRGLETRIMGGVDPEVAADLRLALECRRHLDMAGCAVWELLCLIRSDRPAVEAAASGGADAAKGVLEKVQPLRAELGALVIDLRSYIESLQLGHFGPDTMELVIAFIAAAPKGRARAKDWVSDKARCRGEASGRVEALLRQAMVYQTALNAAPAPAAAHA